MNLFTQLFGGGNIPQQNAHEVKSSLDQAQKPFVLDVRQPEEYRQGHISGSHLIPLGELTRRVKEMPRDREIICVCHSGSRSIHAARELAAAGYKVTNLYGGMFAWERAGLPVKKSSA